MKILVTGADGYLGSFLFKEFRSENQYVRLNSDISKVDQLRKEIDSKKGNGEYVVLHMAAISDVSYCEENYKEAFKINVLGTNNVMEATDSNGRVVLFSSCHVYSGKKYFPYKEKHVPEPVNAYGMTKFGAESILASYPDRKSLALRIGKVYNRYFVDRVLDYEGSVPSFIQRSFIEIRDLWEIVDKLCSTSWDKIPIYKKHNARVLNIGNPLQNFSYSQFYNLIRDKYSRGKLESRSVDLPKYAPRPHRVKLDTGLMKKVIGDFEFRSY